MGAIIGHHGLLLGGSGGDTSFSNVLSLCHYNGTNASTTITDQKSPVWTAAGNAQLSTSQARYGASSLALDNSGDYAQTTSLTSLSSSAWTAELSFKCSTNLSAETRGLFRAVNAGGFGIYLAIANNTPGAPAPTGTYIRLFLSSNGTSNDIANSVYGTSIGDAASIGWTDVALQFDGSAYKVYVNGSVNLTVTSSAAIGSFSSIQLGGSSATAAQSLNGFIDEWRLTNTVARYGASYTPSGPFPDS